MAALLKPQRRHLQTLSYSPRVDVSGTRWRNMRRKSFMHDKISPASSHDCFKEVWIEFWKEKLWTWRQSAGGFCVTKETGDLPKTSEDAKIFDVLSRKE